MSLRITVTMDRGPLDSIVDLAREGLSDRRELNANIAREVAEYSRQYVMANDDHATANRLGASPTNHMRQAAGGIEGQSDADAAYLLVPRASRLRAAFGTYTAVPGPGKKFLTIPVSAEAYGKEAGAFDDLVVITGGPKKALLLVRKGEDGQPVKAMYLLLAKTTIPEQRDLLPSDEEITMIAEDQAGLFIQKLIGGAE